MDIDYDNFVESFSRQLFQELEEANSYQEFKLVSERIDLFGDICLHTDRYNIKFNEQTDSYEVYKKQ